MLKGRREVINRLVEFIPPNAKTEERGRKVVKRLVKLSCIFDGKMSKRGWQIV